MIQTKDYLPSIENFVDALISSRYLDERELWEYLRAFCEMKCNRLAALDPQRNH